MDKALPNIPAKRYFTIGEVSDLCGVKPYVLRYWEQEFAQLKPMKRRGNRRYYQHHEVLLIRRIRELLYDQGFTISGARNRLADAGATREAAAVDSALVAGLDREPAEPAPIHGGASMALKALTLRSVSSPLRPSGADLPPLTLDEVRDELQSIRSLLAL
ncbi:MAG: MerR family transcriptional regulator [Burkholderiaceae bacterium]